VPLKGKHSKRQTWSLSLKKKTPKKTPKEGNHAHFSELSSLARHSELPTAGFATTSPDGNRNHRRGWREKSQAQCPARSPKAQAGQTPPQTTFVALLFPWAEHQLFHELQRGPEGPLWSRQWSLLWSQNGQCWWHQCPTAPLQTSCSPKSDAHQVMPRTTTEARRERGTCPGGLTLRWQWRSPGGSRCLPSSTSSQKSPAQSSWRSFPQRRRQRWNHRSSAKETKGGRRLLHRCTFAPGGRIRDLSPRRSPVAPLRAKIPGQRQCWEQPCAFPQPRRANSTHGAGMKEWVYIGLCFHYKPDG